MKTILKNHRIFFFFCFIFLAGCINVHFRSRDYAARGEMYLKTAEYAKAEKYLNKAIEANPYNLEAYKNRGALYFTLGNYEEALKDFNYALEYDKYDSSTLSAKGAVLANLGRYQEAYNNLFEAIRLNPSNVSALNSMAGLLYITGDFKKAKEVYTISLEYRTTPEAYLMRAKCCEQLGQTEEAERDYALAKILKLGTADTSSSAVGSGAIVPAK